MKQGFELRLLFFSAIILLQIVWLAGCKKTGQVRPNILLIIADDAGWHDVGYHGSEIETPHIDRLAAEGVELDQFYAYPTCSPTRAALLSGRYASKLGILHPIAMKSKQVLPKDGLTLAQLLRRNGYQTALFGKWHLGLTPQSGPNHYGFDYSYGYLHGQIDQYSHRYKNGDRSWHRNGNFIEEKGHATDLITIEAIRYLTEKRNTAKPFFLYIAYSVPHYPLQEEKKWVEPYIDVIADSSRRLFAASMTHLDAAIGRLVKTLEEKGWRENTLIVFISDNGAQEKWSPTFEYDGKYGPYDRLGDNTPLRGWKKDLYEGGIRVPALITWPKVLQNRREEQPIHVVDLYPTLAAVAGITTETDTLLDGKNVWPLLQSGVGVKQRYLYWRSPKQLALRIGDWKLVVSNDGWQNGKTELYNMKTDPTEKFNIAHQHPQITDSLFKKLKQFAEEDGLPLTKED